jgi:hypothetical protein
LLTSITSKKVRLHLLYALLTYFVVFLGSMGTGEDLFYKCYTPSEDPSTHHNSSRLLTLNLELILSTSWFYTNFLTYYILFLILVHMLYMKQSEDYNKPRIWLPALPYWYIWYTTISLEFLDWNKMKDQESFTYHHNQLQCLLLWLYEDDWLESEFLENNISKFTLTVVFYILAGYY